MSILNVSTAFTNVSRGPYVIDEFWVNTDGFASATTGQTLALPGLYGQGVSILSCSLLAPGTGAGVEDVLGANTVKVKAKSNLTDASGIRVLYNALGTGTVSCGSGLGATLPGDSWIVLENNGAVEVSQTGKAIGLAVKYINLTQTQNRGYGQ